MKWDPHDRPEVCLRFAVYKTINCTSLKHCAHSWPWLLGNYRWQCQEYSLTLVKSTQRRIYSSPRAKCCMFGVCLYTFNLLFLDTVTKMEQNTPSSVFIWHRNKPIFMQIFSIKEILVRVLCHSSLPGNLEAEEAEARDAVWKNRPPPGKTFSITAAILTVKQKPDLI